MSQASTSIPNLTVTFFSETLNMSGVQIGIASLSVLSCTIPGAYIGSWVSRKWNPKISMQLDLLAFLIVNTIGFLILRSPKQQMISYFIGGLWGLVLGWLYSTEVAIFSLLMPPGQESELSGKYNRSLPPLCLLKPYQDFLSVLCLNFKFFSIPTYWYIRILSVLCLNFIILATVDSNSFKWTRRGLESSMLTYWCLHYHCIGLLPTNVSMGEMFRNDKK